MKGMPEEGEMLKIKIIGNSLTTDKTTLKSVNDNVYTIDRSLPMLQLEDNSYLIFPGMDIFMMFFSDKTFHPEPDYLDEDIIKMNIDIREDVNPEENNFQGKGIVGLDIIGLDMVTDGEEKAQYIQLFRVYV